MEVSLRAPCKADHFHFTLAKAADVESLPAKGKVYSDSGMRFLVEEVIPLKPKPAVILEVLPGSIDAFTELVNKVTAPVPIRGRSRAQAQLDGWGLLPGSRGSDPYTKEEWECIKNITN